MILMIGAALILSSWLQPARAAVIVLANRTAEKVDFRLRAAHGVYATPATLPADTVRPYRDYAIKSADTLTLPVLGPVEMIFPTPTGEKSYLLEPNTVCWFGSFDEGLDLQQISFNDEQLDGAPEPMRAALLRGEKPGYDEKYNRAAALAPTAVIPVKVLVDDNEAARTEVWQQRLRDRLQQASQIIERSCRVRFEIVEFDHWDGDDQVNDFDKALVEFEAEVDPAPARLAIGFASQFEQPNGPTKLGGVRGPFWTHCLIREWPKIVSEPERLEVLVHELSHILGAAHSPEPDSVMRPRLGDGQARARAFRIRIDPVNTLLLNLTGEELRQGRDVYSLAQMGTAAKLQMAQIYVGLGKTLPDDPAAKAILGQVERSVRHGTRLERGALAEATRQILDGIIDAARQAAAAPVAATSDTAAPLPAGDRRLQEYVAAGGEAARRTSPRHRPAAFALALALAVDPDTTLAKHPQMSALIGEIESDAQRRERVQTVGECTMRGRTDLARHFFLSAALAAVLGAEAAEQLGLAKELADSQGGTGFSFVDYATDLAGIHFAAQIKRGTAALDKYVVQFSVASVLPETFALEEGLSEADFERRYGSIDDPRFLAMRERIMARLTALSDRPKPAAHRAAP